jgi:hypothetical protein
MGDDNLSLALAVLWGAVVICILAYVIYRLLRDSPPDNLSETSKSMARKAGFPKLFDALLARSMTGREKFGWLLVVALMVIAAVFTPKSR